MSDGSRDVWIFCEFFNFLIVFDGMIDEIHLYEKFSDLQKAPYIFLFFVHVFTNTDKYFLCLLPVYFADEVLLYVFSVDFFCDFDVFKVPLHWLLVVFGFEEEIAHKFIDLVVIVTIKSDALVGPELCLVVDL